MNFKIIQRIALLLFIFVSSGSFAQYKYDIGLKASTSDMERFQLEGRFHLDTPYSITATLVSGSRSNSFYYQTPVYGDSLYDVFQSSSHVRNTAIKLGVQRKLGFLATDFFYVGSTIGFGYEQHDNSTFTSKHSYFEDTLISNPGPYLFGYWNEVESDFNSSRTNSINAQLGLSFGMDVPITKRFSINAELGFSGLMRKNLDYDYTIVMFHGTISGGLRYSFGKRA